jgi:hypothetical protein
MRKAEQQAGVPRATAQHDPEKLAQNYTGTTTASRRPIPSKRSITSFMRV